MADENYARLLPGGLSLAALVPQKRGRGRPKGPGKSGWEHQAKHQCRCQSCGASFMGKRAAARFCGSKCRNKVTNRAKQERTRNSAPRPCRWCQKVYAPEYGSLRTHYCTTDCRDAAKRKQNSGSTHRRRIKKYGATSEAVNRLKVFARDGWRCYLCGCETPKELSGTTEPAAPELEHVVPLSKGGEHTYENVRCACRQCNRAKGSLLPG